MDARDVRAVDGLTAAVLLVAIEQLEDGAADLAATARFLRLARAPHERERLVGRVAGLDSSERGAQAAGHEVQDRIGAQQPATDRGSRVQRLLAG